MKRLILLLLFTWAAFASAQTGELKGKIFDKATGNVIDDASIAVYYGDSLFTSVIPGFDGSYSVGFLPEGRVTVICTKETYATLVEKNIPVTAGKATAEDFYLRKSTRSNDIDLLEYKEVVEEKKEVQAEEPKPAPQPVPAAGPVVTEARPAITLIPDSVMRKGSQKTGYYFKIGDREPQRMKMLAGNLSPLLYPSPAAMAELKKYRSKTGLKLGLQAAFLGLVGVYAGSMFFDKENENYFSGYRIVLLGGAAVCFSLSALFEETKSKHLHKAVEIYNAGK